MEENKTIVGLVSIIVPVYNVEGYLEDTVKSILSQDYQDWELLLVDDGSTDRSAEICDKYASIDDRIMVFHLQNSGVSHARNIGMERSRGEYIVFCDSDDMLSPECLSVLKKQLESTNADIVHCEQKTIGANTHDFEAGNCTYAWKTFDADNFISIPQGMYHTAWGNMFRKSLIVGNNITFDERLNRGEDTLFVCETMLCSSRIVYSRNEYVNYRITEGSLMRSKPTPPLYRQCVQKYYALCDFVSGRSLDVMFGQQIRGNMLMAVAEALVQSVEDKDLFKSNFQELCADKLLQQSLRKRMGGFPKRIRLAVFMILLSRHVKMASLVRLLVKPLV